VKLNKIIKAIEEFAPLSLQESYDNSGLIIGSTDMEISSALLCIDITEDTIQEAIDKNCNLIISHHPIVFKGLKRFNKNNYVERCVIKAIKNDIAIYSAHTNIDSVRGGVSERICEKLNLKNKQILSPSGEKLRKLVCYVPSSHTEQLRIALFDAGAGHIGKYSSCSYNTEGIGTFMPEKGSNPFVGEIKKLHHEKETRIEVVFPQNLKNKVINSLLANHPYEEVAYDIFILENINPNIGLGMTGELEKEIDSKDFLNIVKKTFKCGTIRHTDINIDKIKKVSVCGGSGSSLLKNAIASKSDIFITADFKYHEFFDAENKIIIADIGHYESEQFTNDIFYEILTKKITNFAVHISGINSNPINYL